MLHKLARTRLLFAVSLLVVALLVWPFLFSIVFSEKIRIVNTVNLLSVAEPLDYPHSTATIVGTLAPKQTIRSKRRIYGKDYLMFAIEVGGQEYYVLANSDEIEFSN
jgi:hypothetical protein